MKLFYKSILAALLLFSGVLGASVAFDVFDPNTRSLNAGATNEVRRFGIIRVTKTDTHYRIETTGGVREPRVEAVIVDNKLADIIVIPKIVNKTHAQVRKAGKIEADFVLKSKPNPLTVGGYQVYLEVLDMQYSYIDVSKNFLNYQTNAVSEDQSQLLFFSILNNKTPMYFWNTVQDATLITDTWSSDRIIRLTDTFGSEKKTTKTLKVSIPYTSFFTTVEDLITLENVTGPIPNGVYEFRFTMGMEPYAKQTLQEQIDQYNTITSQQVSSFDNLFADMDVILDNPGQLNNLPASQQTQLKKNRDSLRLTYRTFLKAIKAQYQTFAADPDATSAQLEEIDAFILAIDTILDALNRLIAASS